MSAVDFNDPIYRVNPPPPTPEPQPKPAFDPTANPIWGPLFTEHPAPRGYRVRPEDVWLKAKDEYLRGFSAEAVCAEFGLGLSAFRQRARREGWRRADQTEADPEAIAFPMEPEAAPPTEDLADLAWRSAAQAIRRGRVYEARAWMRLANELKAQARDEASAARNAQFIAARRAAAALEDEADEADPEDSETAQLHTLHGGDGVQSGEANGGEEEEEDPEFWDEPEEDDEVSPPLSIAQLHRWIADLEAGVALPRGSAAMKFAIEEARALLAAYKTTTPDALSGADGLPSPLEGGRVGDGGDSGSG